MKLATYSTGRVELHKEVANVVYNYNNNDDTTTTTTNTLRDANANSY